MSLILRRLVAPCVAARSIRANIVPPSAASYSTLILAEDRIRPPFLSSSAPICDRGVFPSLSRNFSSSPPSDQSKVVLIESEKQFNDSLPRFKMNPCLQYSTLRQLGVLPLSEKYPNVNIYKVDIDTEGLGNTLSKLNINSVPTLHFFQDGKKTSEIIGADAQRMKETMDMLFK